MKKLNLLGAISLFLVFSGFTCQNNLDTVVPEQDDSIPVCETKGKLLKNLKGNMAWSEAVNNWVLWIDVDNPRSEEHTSELQSLMRISYAVFCLNKKNKQRIDYSSTNTTNKDPNT